MQLFEQTPIQNLEGRYARSAIIFIVVVRPAVICYKHKIIMRVDVDWMDATCPENEMLDLRLSWLVGSIW